MIVYTGEISLFLKALHFSAAKHRDQRRKDEQASPYINHLIEVADILWETGRIRDMTTIIAGILHDTLEDTNTTPEELDAAFGSEIRSIVGELTDDKSLPQDERRRLQVEHAGKLSVRAQYVKLADKISNIGNIIDSPPGDWSSERKLEYVAWGEEVIDKLRGSNEPLERHFDALAERARREIKAGNKV